MIAHPLQTDAQTAGEDAVRGEIGEWRANWGLVLTASIAIAVVGTHYHVVGTMMKPLGSAYGWTRGEVAMALTIASFLSPFTNPAVGWLADRFGPRRIALIGVPLLGVSFASLGLTGPQLWTWYVGYALFGIFHNAAGAVVWTMAVVRRFTLHRGMALALALSGSGVLVAIIPTIVLALLELVGIRATFAVLGAAAVLLTLPLALIFLPKDHEAYRQAQAQQIRDGTAVTGFTVREALASSRFWRLAIAFLIVSTCVGMFILHFQSMLTDRGMTGTTAASVAIFLGPTMIVGRLLTGFLFDHFETRLVAAVAFVLPGIACLMLLGLDGSFLFAAATAVVIGLGMGAEVDVLAYMTSKYFGLRRYGVLFGILIGLYGVGVGVGSAVAGHVYDITGSYNLLLIIMSILASGAGLLAATLGRPPALAFWEPAPPAAHTKTSGPDVQSALDDQPRNLSLSSHSINDDDRAVDVDHRQKLWNGPNLVAFGLCSAACQHKPRILRIGLDEMQSASAIGAVLRSSQRFSISRDYPAHPAPQAR